jgi:gamma-glutamyltranspeptidase/glutathione hydrolase
VSCGYLKKAIFPMTENTVATRVAHGHESMIATGHPIAAAAAQSILRRGGNAIDAAIAADAVLGVVEPMATGIGGDLQVMIVEPDGAALTYNGTGRAPMALSADMVEALPKRRIPERHPLSLTVPGAVRGWHDLHQRYGSVPWSELFATAIGIADNGFAVAPVAASEWRWFQQVLTMYPHCAQLYRATKTPKAGERFTNAELASVLRGIASEGPGYFYEGEPARAAQSASLAAGGVLMATDFQRHQGNFCEPLRRRFQDLTVLECPPNSHGCAVLDALEAIDEAGFEPHSAAAFIGMVEATGRAMAKARETVADPSGNTVCTVIVDGSGRAVTLMSSIFKRFGSGIAVPGCGFVLQNRGFGFSAPGHLNGPAPGKRPYHTVIPAACLRDGRFHAGFGVVGGLMQPQGHIQLLTRLAAWGQALPEAIAAPRWRLEAGDTLACEASMPEHLVRALRAAGYAEPDAAQGELAGRSDFGGAQVVMRSEDGALIGASDPRKDGAACSG